MAATCSVNYITYVIQKCKFQAAFLPFPFWNICCILMTSLSFCTQILTGQGLLWYAILKQRCGCFGPWYPCSTMFDKHLARFFFSVCVCIKTTKTWSDLVLKQPFSHRQPTTRRNSQKCFILFKHSIQLM